MAMHRGWVETFQHDQLVVALPDLRAVTQALADLGVRLGRIDKSAALGLALVRDLDRRWPRQSAASHMTRPSARSSSASGRAAAPALHPGTSLTSIS